MRLSQLFARPLRRARQTAASRERRRTFRSLPSERLEDRSLLATLYVNDDAGGLNTGASWADAFTDLQSALGAAGSGDEIWVAEGTYKPTTGANRAVSFNLRSGVGVYGGFAGDETERTHRDWQANSTTLSGDLGVPGDVSDNSYHVIFASSVSGARLDGFTVTGGRANVSGNDRGGGIYTEHSTLVLANALFTGNSAHGGGGMSNSSSAPLVANVTFSGNSATLGGGIHNVSSSPTLTNVAFSHNTAGANGGGIYNIFSSPTLTNITVSGNSAAFGGGIYNVTSGHPTLTNGIVWGNEATSAGPEIFESGAAVATVTYSIVKGGWPGAGNLGDDPLFVDAAGDNLRLMPGSPAINVGNSAAVPADAADLDADGNTAEPTPLDLDLLPRIARSAVDLGAYEYQNTPPVAGDDSFTTSEDEAASGNVLANDTDVDGDALSVVAVNGSAAGIGHSVATAHGSVTLNADGTFTYKPGAACEATSDTFTYAISDGHGGTSAASVNISIVRAVADGAIELSEGILRIGGTAGHDLITVIQLGGTVFVAHVGQGGYAAFDASQVAEIRIWGREAGDLVTLINVRADSAIFGGDGDDILVGGRGQDVIFGGSGDDLVTGGVGDDFLIGGAGRDRLVGGSGDDVLVAGDVACEFSLQMLRDISRAWAEFRCTPEEEGDGAIGKAIVDTDYDILTGSSGADLFFISAGDKITDYRFDKPKANKDGDVVRFVD